MKKAFLLMFALMFSVLAGPAVQQDGASKGVWTMDYDAALAAAKADNMPVLVLFTGSDWCSWCKLMDEKVYSQPEWQAYAKENLYLVYLDFPQKQDLVPEKYRSRNQKLQEQYMIEGYPTMVLLDSRGKESSRLSADEKVTPASFISSIRLSLLFTPGELEKAYAKLAPADAKELRSRGIRREELVEKMRKMEADHEAACQMMEKKFALAIQPVVDELKTLESFQEDVVVKLLEVKGGEEAARFKALKKERDELRDALGKWLETGPKKSEENDKIFSGYQTKIGKIQADLQKILLSILP